MYGNSSERQTLYLNTFVTAFIMHSTFQNWSVHSTWYCLRMYAGSSHASDNHSVNSADLTHVTAFLLEKSDFLRVDQ